MNNMGENIVFATGYPIGFVTINDYEYYSIQLNDNTYPVNLLCAFVWLEALKGGRTKIDVMDNVIEELQIKGYELGKHFTLENLEYGYSNLLSSSLIIEVSVENMNELLEKYSELKPFRNGFGMGMEFDKIVIHHESQDIEVEAIEYYIWQLSTGNRNLSVMYEEYKKSFMSKSSEDSKLAELNEDELENNLKELFVEAFMSLYKKNLVYIANI